MKRKIIGYLCWGLLLSTPTIQGDTPDCSSAPSTSNNSCIPVKTCFLPISQGSNLYTQYHEPFDFDKNDDTGTVQGYLDINYRFQQTSNGNQIAQSLFGQNPITFRGSYLTNTGEVTTDPTNAWMAEYFGFGPNTNFSLALNPRIRNNIVDIEFACGGEHLWVQCNIPIVRTNWQLNNGVPLPIGTFDKGNLQEQEQFIFAIGVDGLLGVQETAKMGHDTATLEQFNISFRNQTNSTDVKDTFSTAPTADGKATEFVGFGDWGTGGYLVEDPTPTSGEMKTITTPMAEDNFITNVVPTDISYTGIAQNAIPSASTVQSGLAGNAFGDVKAATYNKWNICGCTSKWGVADLQLQAGYDFVNSDTKHFGLYIKGVIPTYGPTNSCWAQNVFSPMIGNGGHVELGLGISGHREVWGHGDHVIAVAIDGYLTHLFSRQQFRTFDRLPADRFAIVKELKYVKGSGNENADGSDFSYHNTMLRWGDLTAQCVKTTVNLRGEFIFDLTYSSCNWDSGIGYAFSGESSERAWPLCGKGNTVTPIGGNYGTYYGYKAAANLDGLGMVYAPLNTTTAMTLVSLTTLAYDKANANSGPFYVATASWVAEDGLGGISWADDTAPHNPSQVNSENTKMKDVFLPGNADITTGMMGAQTLNRIFAHIDYSWDDLCLSPFIGIEGAYGFTAPSTLTAAYWDIGAHFGVSF